MNLQPIADKLKAGVQAMNRLGVPLPVMRDPKTGLGSVTLTMTWISFNTALLGQLGKITNILGPIDLTQANYLFLMCLGAYLGRKMQSDATNKTNTIEGDSNAGSDASKQ